MQAFNPLGFNPLAGNPFVTRDDVAAAVAVLFRPLLPCFSGSGARVEIEPYGSTADPVAAALEGFARPLWGLAPLAAGGGGEEVWWRLYRAGLAAGSDPAHPDYWGEPAAFDQRIPEAAAIAFALLLAGDRLWTPLPDQARANLIDWLASARATRVPANNWLTFLRIIDLALDQLAERATPGGRAGLGRTIAQWHLGNGWYRDGAFRQADHYGAFAIHSDALIVAALGGLGDDAAARARERAKQFAQGYRHWHASDGAALPFGRSLSYRFATAGFWGALAFADVEAMPWGEIKGLYLRNLRWWASQPIARRDGLLSLGYAYPNPQIAEDYSAAGSPYWAFKAFLPLALAADHPFWATEEEASEMPADPVPLGEAGMIVRHEPGQTIALATGQENVRIRHGAEKYAKFAYSTRHAFCIETDPRRFDACALDNMIGFSTDGADCRVRTCCAEAAIADGLLWSRWHPWEDVSVDSWLWWDGAWQMRVHRVRSPMALRALEGGFAVPPLGRIRVGLHRAQIVADAGVSAIVGPEREARVLRVAPNSSLSYPRALVPQLSDELPVGETVLTAAVLSTVDRAAGERLLRDPPGAPSTAVLEARIAAAGRPIAVHRLDSRQSA